MSTEEKKVTDGQPEVSGQGEKDLSRSEQRQKDLADKLAEQERVHALKIEEERTAREKAEKEAKEARFEADFIKESVNYPHAKEYQADIRSYVEKGLSVNEATTLVLSKNNRLVTGRDVERQHSDASSFGGSSVSANPSGSRDPEKMTQEERRTELLKLQDNGAFGINSDGGLFLK